MAKLNKIVKAIHALLQGTSATVTLKWGDGRYAIISRHGYNVRIPEKLTMKPLDTAELHKLEPVEFEGLDKLIHTNSIGQLFAAQSGHQAKVLDGQGNVYNFGTPANRDKIQGDPKAPWIPDDSKPT